MLSTLALWLLLFDQSSLAESPPRAFNEITNEITDEITVDFDEALQGLSFDVKTTDGNGSATGDANGIVDSVEMALVARILRDDSIDLSANGGVTHAAVLEAYSHCLKAASADTEALAQDYPTVALVVTGYALLGKHSFEAIATMTNSFGAPLEGDYEKAIALGAFLGPEGDADGDGASNLHEHQAFIGDGIVSYLTAALDPNLKPEAGQAPPKKQERARRKNVGIVLYPGFEVLDVYGPVEMWGYVPDFQLVFVAEEAGPVRSSHGVKTLAEYGFEDCPPLDILMVPGGFGTRACLRDETFLEFLRQRHEEVDITTSVCSGSAILAKAGILDGRRATSNKVFFSLAENQSDQVEWVRKARWVDDGDIITSSGVTAGMDMALHLVARLYGEESADMIARSVEYIRSKDADDDPFAIEQ